MKERLSITWSNRHQQLFNEAMSDAVKTGSLTVMRAGEIRFSDGFFDQRATKDFLDRLPREILDEMVKPWIEKRRKAGTLPEKTES